MNTKGTVFRLLATAALSAPALCAGAEEETEAPAAPVAEERLVWGEVRAFEPGWESLGLAYVACPGDFDADGDPEVVVSFAGKDNALFDPYGRFAPDPRYLASIRRPGPPSYDGKIDDGGVFVYERTADGGHDLSFVGRRDLTMPPGYGHAQVRCKVFDVDADGDLDVFTGSRWRGGLSWWINAGDGSLVTSGYAIPFPALGSAADIRSFAPADIDGDGDLDILYVYNSHDWRRIVWPAAKWHDNPGFGNGLDGPPWRFDEESIRRFLAFRSIGGTHAAVDPGDINGDGDMDALVGQYSGHVYWATPMRGWHTKDRPDWRITIGTVPGVWAVRLADLDGDGDLDAIAGGWDGTFWFENRGGADFAERSTLRAGGMTPFEIGVADLDGDGDLDVFEAGEPSYWYENLGEGRFAAPRVVAQEASRFHSIRAADIDADGDLDLVLSHQYLGAVWVENLGVQPVWSSHALVTGGVTPAASRPDGLSVVGAGAFTAVHAADLDADGDLDVLTGALDGVAWRERGDEGLQDPETIAEFSILVPDPYTGSGTALVPQRFAATAIVTADFDGDGDLDAAFASKDGSAVSWSENLGARESGRFGVAVVVDAAEDDELLHPTSLRVADLDGDGDADLYGTHAAAGFNDAGAVVWYENRETGFSARKTIADGVGGALDARAADFDGDGHLDLVSVSPWLGLAWHRNDGEGGFAAAETLIAGAAGLQSADVADFDGDGDLDIVFAAAWLPYVVGWLANEGDGAFSGVPALFAQNTRGPRMVRAVDFDNDGDADVLESSWRTGNLAVYANDGAGAFGERVIVQDFAPVRGSERMVIADFDGMEQPVRVVEPAVPEAVQIVDMDGDGFLDVLAASAARGRADWHRNPGPLAEEEEVDPPVEPRPRPAARRLGDTPAPVLRARTAPPRFEAPTLRGAPTRVPVDTPAARYRASFLSPMDGDTALGDAEAGYVGHEAAQPISTREGVLGRDTP